MMRRTILIAALSGLVGALIAVPLTVYASHIFGDVPESHIFHDDIGWLEQSGVTRGCNPPANTQFCPDDGVTRGQMAAFMRRFAQYLDAEDGTPAQADNTDTLDGIGASEFVRSDQEDSVHAAMVVDEPGLAHTVDADVVTLPTADYETLYTVDLEAPADGWAVVAFDTNVGTNHQEGSLSYTVLGVSATADSLLADERKEILFGISTGSGIRRHAVAGTKVFPVSAGVNTFHLVGRTLNGLPGGIFGTHLSAIYISSAYGTVQTSSVQQGPDLGELGIGE